MRVKAPARVGRCLFLLALATLLALTILLTVPREPRSHGHPLSYWLEHYKGSGTEADAAIREIGTNALPALLVWLRYEPSQTKTNIQNFLRRVRKSAHGRWVPAALTYDHGVPPASVGFLVLGPSAAEAIPELERIANDAAHPKPAARAMIALSAIGPKALPAVEARLSNTNFPSPFPPDAALNIYLRTRTLHPTQGMSTDMAKPILIELQTNKNPALVEGAKQVLKALDFPSSWERRQPMTVGEALSDLRLERESARQRSQIITPKWKMRSAAIPPRQPLTNSVTLASAASPPPAQPQGDEPYPYPLLPGTAAWNDATVQERLKSVEIPKSWRGHATSWQLFRSAIAHPYFRSVHLTGEDMVASYNAARKGTVSILSEVDTAPDFGTNVLRWLSGLDLAKMADIKCSESREPCWKDYLIVCYMAGLDSALETMDLASRQRLFRLAVWDADYFLSRDDTMTASGPIGLMYAIYNRPENFRGALPREVVLPPLPASQSAQLSLAQGATPQPANLRLAVAAAKTVLGLTQRP